MPNLNQIADVSLKGTLNAAQAENRYLKERYADVLERERVLLERLSLLQQRCLHDFVNLLMNSINDTQPTDDPREVLRCLAVAVSETGSDDLGAGECSCKKSGCPYK